MPWGKIIDGELSIFFLWDLITQTVGTIISTTMGPGVRSRSLLQRQAARCAAVWRRAISAHWVLFYGYAGGLEQRKQTISCFKLCIICYSCGMCINTERINLTLRYLFLHNIFLERLTLRYPIGVETDSRTPPTIEPQYLKKKILNFFLCDSRTPLRDNRTPINSLIIFMFDNNRTLLDFKFLKFSTTKLQFLVELHFS